MSRKERPTRSEIRGRGERSARLARDLMQMKDNALAQIPLDEDLREEILHARSISSPIARRREERRLAGVLRDDDVEAIEEALSGQRDRDREAAAGFTRVERWRDRLVSGDDGDVDAFVTEHAPDPAALRELVDEARREKATGRPRGAGKRLFRYVRELVEEPAADDA